MFQILLTYFILVVLEYLILCCIELTPHITGDPTFPGEAMLNESVRQSPIAGPSAVVAGVPTAVVVPRNGSAIVKVWIVILNVMNHIESPLMSLP